MLNFSSFCGGDIWDANLTWDTVHPDFTECFQNSVLVWVPCGFLWLVLPFYACYLKPKIGWHIPPNGLNRLKTLVCLLMMVAMVTEAIKKGLDHKDGKDVPMVLIVSPSIMAATLLVAAILMRIEREKGRISSGVLWCFWFSLLVAGIILTYSKIKNWNTDMQKEKFSLIIFFIYYGLLLVQFMMSFKSDVPHHPDASSKVSRELFASFPSYFSFWWVNGLLLKGFKKDLEEGDIWELNPRDVTTKSYPKFETYWNQALKEFKIRMSRLRFSVDLETSSNSPHNERTPLLANKIENKAAHSASQSSEKSSSFKAPDRPNAKSKEMEKAQQQQYERPSPSLVKALTKSFGGWLLWSHFWMLFYSLLMFIGPLLQSQLIDYTDKAVQVQEWKGYLYAVGFFLVANFQSIFFHQSFHISMTLAMRIKAVLIAAVYKKSLTMSNEARTNSTVGEIVNLMSVDCVRIQDATGYLYILWSSPLLIGVSMYMLYLYMGPAIFAGVAVLVLLFPVNGLIMAKMRKYQIEQLKLKDDRIKLMNEVLAGIKVLKLYAWEPSFQEKVNNIRRQELHSIKIFNYLAAGGSFFWYMAPFLVTLATFATYILTARDNILDAKTAFVSLSLFNILRFPINILPMVLTMLIQANVSLGRLSRFLSQEDLDLDSVQRNNSANEAVLIENGTFSWQKNIKPTLSRINVKIPVGSMTAIVGQVGVGKTSLISALLGELHKITGRVNVKGSTAYVPQQAWIQNVSMRDNILFGSTYEPGRYGEVIEACALIPDLDILPSGDQTEIGEKGINLSGGQKQRVSLARAVYNDADIYYLDDPLSAVDSHVGKHIFDKVIGANGLLRNKTRVLVTHGIQWLPFVDQILVVTDGQISEVGTYDELLNHNGPFANFLKTYFLKAEDGENSDEEDNEVAEIKTQILQRVESVISDDPDSDKEDVILLKRASSSRCNIKKDESLKDVIEALTNPKSKDDVKQNNKPNGHRLTEDESSNSGRVKFSVLSSYIRAVGPCLSTIIFLMFVVYQSSSVFSTIWLAQWTADPYLLNKDNENTSKYKDKQNLYLAVYGGTGVIQVIFVLVYGVMLAIGVVEASTKLHSRLLSKILTYPMSFFDTTPSGRILNRFSSDIDTVDRSLPMSIRQFILFFLIVLSTLFIISYSSPWFIVVIVPLAIFYTLIQRFYIATSRQLKRLESVTRSPIFVHFSETITGASSIRAYQQMDRFIAESEVRVDHNNAFYFASLVSNRWLGYRLEVLGSLVIFSAAIFAVIGRNNNITPGLVGLSISYALQITSGLNMLTRQTSELERNLVAVERIIEYSSKPSEAEWLNPACKPANSWPENGAVHINTFSTRYREGLDLVLKGITCEIKAGEKVGVVGRTGAGKSSMTLSLFRLIEAAGGNITIDGVDISRLGLHDLRSKLTILPQDPVLFSGTLRMNLDPFDDYDDDTIWSTLEHSHLKDFVTSSPNRLQHEVGEGGQNLSVGQRQLVCLGRSLLRKTKILILDEATAAVDLETDDLIQNTIRTEFADCTVLTIAHRLNTIMDSDRVMVLDAGEIKEFNSPSELLTKKGSMFYAMCRDAGLL